MSQSPTVLQVTEAVNLKDFMLGIGDLAPGLLGQWCQVVLSNMSGQAVLQVCSSKLAV